MDGIRTLVTIFYVLGWLVVSLAALAGLGLLLAAVFALGRGGSAGDFVSALLAVVTLGAASLTPFFCGAVLEILAEIYGVQQVIRGAVVRTADGMAASALGSPAFAAVSARALPAAPRTIIVTAPDQAARTVECPNCGRPNATWRSTCADCQATLA